MFDLFLKNSKTEQRDLSNHVQMDDKTFQPRSHSTLRPNHGQNASKSGLPWSRVTILSVLKPCLRRATDGFVRVEAVFKTSYKRFVDVVGRGEKFERHRTRKQVLNCSKFYTADNHGWHTW